MSELIRQRKYQNLNSSFMEQMFGDEFSSDEESEKILQISIQENQIHSPSTEVLENNDNKETHSNSYQSLKIVPTKNKLRKKPISDVDINLTKKLKLVDTKIEKYLNNENNEVEILKIRQNMPDSIEGIENISAPICVDSDVEIIGTSYDMKSFMTTHCQIDVQEWNSFSQSPNCIIKHESTISNGQSQFNSPKSKYLTISTNNNNSNSTITDFNTYSSSNIADYLNIGKLESLLTLDNDEEKIGNNDGVIVRRNSLLSSENTIDMANEHSYNNIRYNNDDQLLSYSNTTNCVNYQQKMITCPNIETTIQSSSDSNPFVTHKISYGNKKSPKLSKQSLIIQSDSLYHISEMKDPTPSDYSNDTSSKNQCQLSNNPSISSPILSSHILSSPIISSPIISSHILSSPIISSPIISSPIINSSIISSPRTLTNINDKTNENIKKAENNQLSQDLLKKKLAETIKILNKTKFPVVKSKLSVLNKIQRSIKRSQGLKRSSKELDIIPYINAKRRKLDNGNIDGKTQLTNENCRVQEDDTSGKQENNLLSENINQSLLKSKCMENQNGKSIKCNNAESNDYIDISYPINTSHSIDREIENDNKKYDEHKNKKCKEKENNNLKERLYENNCKDNEKQVENKSKYLEMESNKIDKEYEQQENKYTEHNEANNEIKENGDKNKYKHHEDKKIAEEYQDGNIYQEHKDEKNSKYLEDINKYKECEDEHKYKACIKELQYNHKNKEEENKKIEKEREDLNKFDEDEDSDNKKDLKVRSQNKEYEDYNKKKERIKEHENNHIKHKENENSKIDIGPEDKKEYKESEDKRKVKKHDNKIIYTENENKARDKEYETHQNNSVNTIFDDILYNLFMELVNKPQNEINEAVTTNIVMSEECSAKGFVDAIFQFFKYHKDQSFNRKNIIDNTCYVIITIIRKYPKMYNYYYKSLLNFLQFEESRSILSIILSTISFYVTVKQWDFMITFILDLIRLPNISLLNIVTFITPTFVFPPNVKDKYIEIVEILKRLVLYEYSMSKDVDLKIKMGSLPLDIQQFWFNESNVNNAIPLTDIRTILDFIKQTIVTFRIKQTSVKIGKLYKEVEKKYSK